MEKEAKFNQIVADNTERIRRICCYYNSDEQDQKDMFQEMLINIWKSLDNFRGQAAMSTWIYRIAVNTALGYSGKRYQYMKLRVSADTQNLSTILDDDTKSEKLLTEQLLDDLQQELNLLSVIDKALMSLVLEGLSLREIADVIGITEPNVKVKIHRIKQELRTKLTEKKL